MAAEPVEARWAGAVAISTAVAAAVYLAAVLWAGRSDVLESSRLAGAGTLGVLLGLSALNYLLRFVRWDYYLRSLGAHVPTLHNLRIYLGGFALTTTPGKVGELARSLWLVPYGVSARHSVSVFVAERIQDFIAIMLLCSLGLTLFAAGRWLLLASLGLVAIALLALTVPAFARRLRRLGELRDGKLGELAARAADVLDDTRACFSPARLALGLLLGVVAWAAEAWAFALLLQAIGHTLPLATAMAIYAFAMLAGAVSALPGGLGGSEATMVLLLTMCGVPLPVAVSATVLIRLATLWFAVLLGILALAVRVDAPPRRACA